MSAVKLGAFRSCAKCGAIISYYPTRAGAKVPLDVEEHADGPFVLEIDLGDTSRTFARALLPGEEYAGRRFVSHATSCGGSR